jgi:hypothetical protein
MKRPAIRLHIEELVLHSFDPHDRHAIADAVQRELSGLLAVSLGSQASVRWAESSDHAHIDAGSFQVEHGANATSIGASIANAVYGGLSR